MLCCTVILLVLAVCVYVRWSYRKHVALSRLLQHDLLSLPILGVAHMFYGSNEDMMEAVKTIGKETIKQGRMIALWFGHKLICVVADADNAEFIFKYCLEKDDIFMRCMRLAAGNSIVSAPVWRPRRKIVTSCFSNRSLTHLHSVFDEQSRDLVEQLRPKVGETIQMLDYFTNYTVGTVTRSVLGQNISKENVSMLANTLELLGSRFLQPWLHHDFVYKLMPQYKKVVENKKSAHKLGKEILASTKKSMQEREEDNKYRNTGPFVRQLILATDRDDRRWFNDLALTEECIILFGAAVDTSATGLSYVALLLARHPEVQEKVYHEIKSVFRQDRRGVKVEDLPNLKYLEAVIKEGLRLYTPVPIVTRQAHKDLILPSGIVVPKGCGIAMHLWAINRNPRHWGADAEEFRPERHLDPAPAHPAQFVSFSYGPRNCLGYKFAMMSAKTVLATLLRRYRLLPAPATHPSRPIRTRYEMMMKEMTNCSIILEARDSDY